MIFGNSFQNIRLILNDKESKTSVIPGVNYPPSPPLLTAAAGGDFWRLLNPGTYQVVVWALGYRPAARRCQVGTEARPTPCHFLLSPARGVRLGRWGIGEAHLFTQLRLREFRLRKLRATTKVLNRRREQQQQVRRTRSARMPQG